MSYGLAQTSHFTTTHEKSQHKVLQNTKPNRWQLLEIYNMKLKQGVLELDLTQPTHVSVTNKETRCLILPSNTFGQLAQKLRRGEDAVLGQVLW